MGHPVCPPFCMNLKINIFYKLNIHFISVCNIRVCKYNSMGHHDVLRPFCSQLVIYTVQLHCLLGMAYLQLLPRVSFSSHSITDRKEVTTLGTFPESRNRQCSRTSVSLLVQLVVVVILQLTLLLLLLKQQQLVMSPPRSLVERFIAGAAVIIDERVVGHAMILSQRGFSCGRGLIHQHVRLGEGWCPRRGRWPPLFSVRNKLSGEGFK